MMKKNVVRALLIFTALFVVIEVYFNSLPSSKYTAHPCDFEELKVEYTADQ